MLHSLVNTVIAAIMTIIAALGLGAIGSSSSEGSSTATFPGSSSHSRGSSDSSSGRKDIADMKLEALPSTAVKATPEQVTQILNSQWLPERAYDRTPLGFARDGETYRITGAVCNGFGVELVPGRGDTHFATQDTPITLMYCGDAADSYERFIGNAFRQANTFYVEGETTAYVAGAQGSLKLTKAGK